MKLEYAKAIVEAMGDDFCEGEEPEVRENYSGRGMYGKTTAGVICRDWSQFIDAVLTVAIDIHDDDAGGTESAQFHAEMARLRHDDMGRSQIIIY